MRKTLTYLYIALALYDGQNDIKISSKPYHKGIKPNFAKRKIRSQSKDCRMIGSLTVKQYKARCKAKRAKQARKIQYRKNKQ